MPLVLNDTPMDPAANAYCDLVAAQAIIDATPNSSAWGIDPVAQTQAIVYATTLLQAMAYQGTKSTFYQALSWPRAAVRDPDYGESAASVGYKLGGSWGVYLDNTVVPVRMIRGCTMLALEILRAGTSDVWGQDATRDVVMERVDVIETQYADVSKRRNIGLKQYPSVWREIFPLTVLGQSGSVTRA